MIDNLYACLREPVIALRFLRARAANPRGPP